MKDATTCLQSLVGVKADTEDKEIYPQYIENLAGVDITMLAKMSNAQDVSGIATARGLIKSAADMMMGDLQLLVGNGWTLEETLGEVCSTCDFTGIYQDGGMGVKVSNVAVSKYGQIFISLITVKANYSGVANLVLNDGANPPTVYKINIENGREMPVRMDYRTDEKMVRISLEDKGIALAKITCPPSQGGCGCGSSKANQNKLRFTGNMGTLEVPEQYGFKVCASLVCSNDKLLCGLVNALPNIFALTMLYKVGELYYTNLLVSVRNNESRTIDEDTVKDMINKFTGLYREKMTGTDSTKSLRTIVARYMAAGKDECITCQSPNRAAWATG